MRSQPKGHRHLCHAIALVLSTLVLLAVMVEATAEGPVKPPRGFVPDERTAIAIAEAVLIPVYGEKKIVGERPFHATLRGSVWEVYGSLPAGWVGGVAVVQVNKDDGRIMLMYHGK